MAATHIPHIPQFSAPVWVALHRISWHSRAGGMLEGLKWHKEGGVRIDGAKDMPSAQPLRVSVDSAIFAGALLSGQNSPLKSNTPLFNTIVVSIGLATDQRYGFVEMDPGKNNSRKGQLEWAGLLMDAVETDVDGTIDCRLNGSCSKPVIFQLREPDPGELSFAAVLEVVLTSDAFHRGQRSCGILPSPA